jgi:hypothetical protein
MHFLIQLCTSLLSYIKTHIGLVYFKTNILPVSLNGQSTPVRQLSHNLQGPKTDQWQIPFCFFVRAIVS